VASLRSCYYRWDHLLRTYNKSQEAVRQERELAAKRGDHEEEPVGGGSQEGEVFSGMEDQD